MTNHKLHLTDVILVWVVEGVYHGRLRGPLVLVNQLPQLLHVSGARFTNF
jgi:hypothetical protein